ATVELIGFHEAGHDGSKQQQVLDTAAPTVTLETRGRGTGSRTAADIVVPPDTEIRSPVTGTVVRGGTYVLYCDYSDDFVVIEPDARPGWEVKMFHFDGLQVGAGDRVVAGVTVIAPRATPLPFESQVDEFTAEPSNPHVHVEVIDPSIPDIPTPGGGC
ncbi:MAG: M23 family metallopeptidase, partial [Actinobacteria bacterium]|nr:M23 family metallopeptidase [Actinomycetota bacterium]NIS32776.1 M23 family metallopeptidase [Actinomycetota bacterium]NIT95216.1 M23 family metallopeptidase [Actinomycetota bacterium]NIU18895.1 M23 family metallopeptidase [Actinomycetota bacterium]NIU65873.1 M23 family metallopeptidase [Actinomycetota bacterium]